MNEEVAKQLLGKNRHDYNKIVEKFSNTRKFSWREFEDFLQYVNEGDTVLDAGCGNGRLIELLSKKNIEYTGIDYSDKLINIARKQHPGHNFLVGDITTLPFSNNKFNVIFCIATLHHIPGQKLRQQTIQGISRILKKNGYLIMTNWNLWQKMWWPMLIQNALQKITGQSQLDWQDILKPWKNEQGEIIIKRYIHSFRPGELKKLLSKNGLIILQQYYTKKGLPANWLTGYNLVTIARKA